MRFILHVLNYCIFYNRPFAISTDTLLKTAHYLLNLFDLIFYFKI